MNQEDLVTRLACLAVRLVNLACLAVRQALSLEARLVKLACLAVRLEAARLARLACLAAHLLAERLVRLRRLGRLEQLAKQGLQTPAYRRRHACNYLT